MGSHRMFNDSEMGKHPLNCAREYGYHRRYGCVESGIGFESESIGIEEYTNHRKPCIYSTKPIEMYDAIPSILEKLRNKTITFLGDSLSLQTFMGFLYALKDHGIMPVGKPKIIAKHFFLFFFRTPALTIGRRCTLLLNFFK